MSSDTYAHNPVTLLHIAAYLRQRGIKPLEIFKRAGIPPSMLLDATSWVSRDLCLALGEQLATLAGEPFPGSRVGQLFKLTDLGAWGRAVVAAPNLRQACRAAASGIGLLQQGTKLHLLTFERHAQLRFGFRGHLGSNPRQHLLGTLVILRKIALLAGAPEAVSVRFSLPYSRGVDVLEETHGPALEFGCEHDAILIDNEILDQPLIGPNGKAALAGPADTATAIGVFVKQSLPFQRPTIESVAAHQNVSVRTLQRRLRDWGFSFEELLDDVRRAETIELISSGDNTITEIAFLVGYSDTAHFSRAFKRWMGRSPREYVKSGGFGHALGSHRPTI
jgi:AraC-like DNA-binding protein